MNFILFLFLRSLSTALICLLTAYKEDFYDPPDYIILNYLLKHSPDRDLKNQCRSLLNRFVNEGENIFKIDSSKLRIFFISYSNSFYFRHFY